MGRAGRQFRALVWKNWLCRIRHPVLSLAEFFWPCILFMILTVLRFQEPPRHRDNCYLQPRDLPSRGVFPFVQGLLCNTGSRCRNTSYEGAMEQHFRTASCCASHLLPGCCRLPLGFSSPLEAGCSPRSRFLLGWNLVASERVMDLNKTEDVIGKLESLHQQPHLWDFLLLLPRLYANNFHIADGILGGGHLLDAVLSSLSALEDLDWLPLNHTFSRVSEMVLKAAVSTLAFLRESGAVATESGYSLSVKELMWDPQKVQADLKSRFGFDDLHAERVLNYSADLQQIPTDSSLEQMLCLALSGSSEDEDNGEGRPADCDPRWSAAKDYLVHAVSRMHLCRQVFDQWWKGSLFQQVLAGIGRGLEALRTQSGEGSQPWKVARALQAALLLLNDSVAADGPEGSHTPARILLYMQRLQSVLQKLPPGPAPTRLLELDGALRNAVAQDLHLVREILVCLEASANNSRSRGPGQSKLEKDVFFKLLMNKSATSLCLSGCLSERGVPLRPRVAGVQEAHGGLTCGPLPSSEASALHKLLGSVQDANQLLQAVITGHTGVPVSIPEDAPDWQGLGTQLREASLPCTRLLRLLRADVSAADCEDQLFSTVGFVRKTCEAARYVNERAGVEIGSLGFSEESPCYKENMDWKSISDNYFAFLNNLIKTPIASMSRVLNYTKELLLFHLDWSESPAMKMDFVHVIEVIINSLYEFGFLRQEQVSEAVGTVYAMRNASNLFLALSEPQKQDIEKILTHIYLHVFQDKDSALLLQIYSSFHQYMYKFLSIQSKESLLSLLMQISKHILDILKQFNFQNISKAFSFLYETTGVLGRLSEISYCQQLLSIFKFLELKAQSLMSTEGPAMEVIHATLRGLKQLFMVDDGFRNSVFQYVSQLLNGSAEALLGNECFVLDNKSISSANYSPDEGLILNLFKNVTQSDGFHDWNDFLNLRDLWVALGDGLVRVKLLNLDQIEKSLFTMETTLSQLKSLPLDTNASREFLYSLLNIFIELSNTSASIDRSVHLMNNFLLRNLTNYEVKLASVITDLRDTVLFLKNVSHDQDLLSCADIFQNVTEFILEGGLLYENSSQRALHILAMLNSTFSSVDTVSRLKGCVTWVSTVSHLCAMYNSSFSQGHLHGVLRSLRDVKDKLNSTLKLVTWMLNIMMEPCSLNTSNINCVNVYLKNVTDFLNVLLTTVFGKEKVPNFEILLTLLNDSTNQVRMIINNFSRDFDFAPQSNWTRFTELILKRIEMSDEMPLQFQNIWLHLVALGKEIQNLVKDISPNILENSTFYKAEKILNIIATSPKEKDIHSLGNSFYQLASYLAFNLSHDLQNSPKIISHEVMRVVGLSIQLMRDVFNSLTPSAYHNIPQEPGDFQVLKKMTSLLRSVKKTDIYLLVDQLERISESTIDFFKNISRLGASDLGIGFFVDLMEKFVDSSHSWSIKHLLRLSRLFPKKDADAVVDAYYMLPHAMTLLRGLGDKNITEALKDVYNFTLLHGIHLSDVTKEDFTVVIKTLMDTIDLVSAQPGILSETLTCLPVFWCWSHTTSGFQQNPRSDACNAHELTSSFYSKVASILDHLHLSPHGDDSQCLNESSQMEITRKVACVIHELMDWSSILLELSEVFHVKTSLVKSVQEFWHKVLPFVPLSGNQSSGSIPELCPGHLIKQVALPIIEKFKNFNFTKVTSDENLPEKLVSLNKILNVDEGAGTSVHIRPLYSEIDKVMQRTNSVALQNIPLPLAHFLESLDLSSLKTLEIIEEFLLVIKNCRVGFMEQLLKTFFLLKENSGNKIFLLLKDIHKDLFAEMSFVLKDKILENLKLDHFLTSMKEDRLVNALSTLKETVYHLIKNSFIVLDACRTFLQSPEPADAVATLWRMETLAQRVLVLLAEDQSLTKDVLCAALHCEQSVVRLLLLSALRGVVLVHDHYQILKPPCITMSGVKVKDLMQNISKLTEELRSLHFSDGTINSILEANISHSKVLSSALTVALSGSCDRDVLRLLLQFPEDGKSESAARELCGLPRAQVFSVIVVLARNLDLRNFVYKTLLPAEASTLLSALLDVVSSLSHLLPRAGRVLERLPAFLHEFKITALLDAPDFQQASQSNQARSSAIGSFQSLMKMVCKDQAPFFSSSDTFLNLPRVNELLGDDKEKFNIPEDSTPFCLKLYQEILQSPNGALVWSFLKPVLHGKILYTPNTPEINKVIQKVNHTFDFVGKLKTLSEILLKVSSIFQSSGNGQMLHRLQEALKNKFIRSFIKSQLHIDVGKLTEKLQIFGGKLDAMLNHTGAGRLRSLGRVLVDVASCVRLNRFRGLASAAALEATAQALLRKNTLLASIIFNSSLVGKNLSSEPLQLPPQVTYSIRTSILYSMRTDLVKNPFWKFHPQSLPADGFKYNYIFVPLQDMIERAIISVQTGQEALDPAAQAQAIPYPCHTSDLFLNNVGFFFPLIMMLTWMVSVASMVRKLVYEREIQLEEYMRMMGVHPAVHFLAWLLENVAVLIVSSAALALILKVSGVFTYSSAWIVFLFLLDFGVSVVTLSYLLSALFSRASVAALCSSLLYTASFLPYIVLLVLHDQLGVLLQTLLCLLSTTAFGQGVFFITFLEGQEEGIQWDNMYQSPELAGMTFGWVCWMILFDSGLYFVCGWYLNNLIPGTFGLRKPWYFPFTTSYWKDLCGLVVKRQSPASSTLFSSENLDGHGSSLQNGEGKLEGGSPGVVLLSVTKEHDRHKAGVWDLTLTFHRDQITALLGTNGAGKTTVISLLTGLYPPTAGTITVNGRSLQKDPSGVRAELGVCLQRDILFDHLTVLEHLLLFASLKVLPGTHQKLREQVHRTLQDVGLTPHQHQQARVLSGGTRRKLSIGIAFLGASRTVVLDEPTSGVDPCSRRGIWDILLKYRRGRTIIFTTHHLDEAEALSDHVAVLQWGRLRCSGPPASLTQAHAQGLCLTLSRQPSVLEADDPKDTACATSLIQTYIPQASLRGSSRGELSYMIPEGADRACFEGLFQALDQNLHQLHLTGYGLSDTTLEEVFLHLLQDSRKQPDAALSLELAPPEPGPGHYRTPAGTPLVRGGPLLLAQTAALLRKRLLHAGRAWKGTISDLLLPVLFVALAMALFMVRPLAINYPPLKLTLGHYDKAETYFFSCSSDAIPVLPGAETALPEEAPTEPRSPGSRCLSDPGLAWGSGALDSKQDKVNDELCTAGNMRLAWMSSSDNDSLELAHVLLRKFGDQDPPCADANPDLENSSCWHTDPSSPRGVQESCGCLKCPNASTRAPYLTNHLGHQLLNLSGLPLEEYLLAPTEKLRAWGSAAKALLCLCSHCVPEWRGLSAAGLSWDDGGDPVLVAVWGTVVSAEAQGLSPGQSPIAVWYNQKGFHSLPSYLNHLNNLILWRHLPPTADWRQYGITLYSHPYGGALLNEDKILESIRQCGVALCIVLGFSILSASIGSSVVRDRVTGAKRLQHMSGLGYRTYWLTNFLFDMLFYLVSVCLCVSVIVAFQLTAFTFRENLAATALLLVLFGYATLPWMYLVSRVFSSSDVAFISYISLNFIFGLCTMLMTVMPRLLAIVSKAQNLQNIYDVLKWVFTIFPQFCLGQGLIELCYNQIRYDLTHNFGIDSYVSPFEMNFLGWIFVQLAVQGSVLLLLRVLLHRDLWLQPRGHSAIQGTVTSSKDIDVEKEQVRVLKGRTNGDTLVLYNLSKSYRGFFKSTTAVQDISLGVHRGECFGLLGVNGAGKTTTFKMLTGDLRPSSGHAVVRTPTGEDVTLSLAGAAGIRVGYCPQQDALDELLTGWEHLRYYCCLHGIPKQSVPKVAGDLVRRLHLEAHVDKPVATYSGGTKRKLSTALALLGKPDLLLLDEPSSGMDPCSKRHLWEAVRKEAEAGCAVVLSSHSMEECEAVCTRLAIMVHGSFRCLGSPQHIKNRFGDVYTVKVWLHKEVDQHSAVSDCLKLYFPGIQFKGQRLNLLEYHMPKRQACLANLFRVLEDNKSFLNIRHYSINQTTLEQIFVNFATEQWQTPSPSYLSAECDQPRHLPV
ncbi:ATP-binding cassette sub-family A member 13 [Dama dama]